MVYYNENDPYLVRWLNRLIRDGLLPDGVVDGRSITEVEPGDLDDFEQCHFFAGIGGWAYALELAGWEGPVWTGSPPCQPFSTAGKRAGATDDRHLWPDWHRLISERRPPIVFGEQVPGAIGTGWWDGVVDDCRAIRYAAEGVVMPAASVGAPHLRHRLWWVAYPDEEMQPLPTDLFGDPFPSGQVPSRRSQKLLQNLQHYVLSQLPEESPGHHETATGGLVQQKRRQSTYAQSRIPEQEPHEGLVDQDSSARQGEGHGIHPRRSLRGTEPKIARGPMRDDWCTAEPEGSEQGLGQPVRGSDRQQQGLHHRKRADCVLRDELRTRNVGGAASPGNFEGVAVDARAGIRVPMDRGGDAGRADRSVSSSLRPAVTIGMGEPNGARRREGLATASISRQRGAAVAKGGRLGHAEGDHQRRDRKPEAILGSEGTHRGPGGGLGDAGGAGLAQRGRPGPLGEDGGSPWDATFASGSLDGRARRVGSGLFPLAHRLPSKVARLGAARRRLAALAGLDGPSLRRAKTFRVRTLSGIGNAIVPQLAARFVIAAAEAMEEYDG